MKDQRKTEIKVGLTVIMGVIVFIWILGWAKNFTLTATQTELKLMFDNVSGLEIGNEVTVNGVKKGHVRDFYVYKTYVIVTITVGNDVELKRDAKFSLELTDLMGGRKIEIMPGYENEPLDIEATHRGVYKTDFAGVVALLSGLGDDVETILKDVRQSLTIINEYLTDEDFNRDVRSSIANLNKVTKKLDEVLAENREDFREITKNTKELTFETKEFVTANREKMTTMVTNLNRMLNNSDSLLNKLNYVVDETISGNNNVGRFFYDDSLYISLSSSLQQMNRLSKIILYQLENDGIRIDADIF